MKKAEYKKMFDLEDKHFWFVGKKLFIRTFLDKYLPKRKLKILDIGCGTGGLTNFLSSYGKVFGVEKNKYAADLARQRGLNVKNGDAQELPLSSNSFDFVTIFDVLYHKNIRNEEVVILEAKRVLKKGCFLLITDCAFDFLRSQHDNALQGNKRFTISYLSKLLEKKGFKIIRSSYVFFSIFPFVFIKRRVFAFLKNNQSDVDIVPKIINYLLIKLLAFEAWLLRFINLPVGSSLIILAKKNN